MELIYEELTRELIGCFFDVHNALGVGYDEPAYQKALQRRFYKKEIQHRWEVSLKLMVWVIATLPVGKLSKRNLMFEISSSRIERQSK